MDKEEQDQDLQNKIVLEVGEKDNRPKSVIILDRLIWIVLIGLLIFLTVTHFTSSCKLAKDAQTGTVIFIDRKEEIGCIPQEIDKGGIKNEITGWDEIGQYRP